MLLNIWNDTLHILKDILKDIHKQVEKQTQ